MTAKRLAPLIIAAALPLAGCISFGSKPPPSLLALSAATPLQPGATIATDDRRAVAVAQLSSPPTLGTQRVMVADGPTQVAYLKDAQWAGPPAALFRGLLAEVITSRTGRVVPDPRQFATQPDTRLSGQLTRFGLDGPGMAAEVVFDAALVRPGSTAVESRRFAARVPVTSATEGPVGVAVNQAANDVATQVADWVGR